tara:strand:- start:1133 stop:1843 length:711 start_codon:yes stop_codon:yes gene_type:complete
MSNQNLTKEKIETILNAINEAKYITPSSQPIKITHHKFRTLQLKDESYIEIDFIDTFLEKLEKDEGIIKIVKLGEPPAIIFVVGSRIDPDDRYYIFEIKDGFDEYCSKIFSKNDNINPTIGQNLKELRISYSEHSRQIILNDFFLIANPDFDSENEQVFFYLYRNSNKLIGKGELMEDLKITLTKDFNKILENLNFKKDLRKAFFDVSKDSIKFYNPVSKQRSEALGIKNIPIQVK